MTGVYIVIKLLLDHGAVIDTTDETILLFAASCRLKDDLVETFKLLIAHGVKITHHPATLYTISLHVRN